MQADAEPHTTKEAQRCALVLEPCRFCGETGHFHVHAGFHCDADQFVWTGHQQIVRGPTGEPLYQDDDSSECLVCNASAPRTMWQADREALAKMRVATIQVWNEYDADCNWRGLVQ